MKKLTAWLLIAALSFANVAAFGQVNRVTGPAIIDAAGANYVNPEGQKASYFAGLGGNTPAATPTDVAILTGSATKVIKVTYIQLTVQATAAGLIEYRLMKYSGGTQSAVNTAFAAATHAGAMDSADSASTVITAGLSGVYTSNPASSGTTVGIIQDWTVTVLANGLNVFTYTCQDSTKCITLRGTTQVLAVNGNGHTLLTGEKFGITFNWTEE